MPRTIIFAGPSISSSLKDEYSSFDFRPPAQQGDIYHLVSCNLADRIVLLDGYYKTVPAVWHKEIIYAINKNIPVYGSSSLGALRAVELERYGMYGYGRIFNWYREGILTRDPDVAVAHASAEEGYRTLTLPIVNILATLLENGLFKEDQELVEDVLGIARSVFFEQRTLRTFLSSIGESTLDANTKSVIQDIFSGSYIDQKLRDSESTLAWVLQHQPANIDTEQLNETLYWDALAVNDSYVSHNSSGLLSSKQALLTFQLLEEPANFMRMRERAISMELCLWIASLYGIKAEPSLVSQMKVQLLTDLGVSSSSLEPFLNQRGLNIQEFDFYIQACAIEREVRERVQYRSPMCSFNRLHYDLLTFSSGGENLHLSFQEMERKLSEVSFSAIDEITETADRIPLSTLEVVEEYRREFIFDKSLSALSNVSKLPISYILTFAKLHGRFKQLINDLLFGLFFTRRNE